MGKSIQGSQGIKASDALRHKAFSLEREKMANQPPLLPNHINVLEQLFDNIYIELQPTSQDYQARHDAVNFVDTLVRDHVSVAIKKQYGLCHVSAFGSFTMDMFTPTGDLDLSLNVEHGVENFSREQKIKILKNLRKCLHKLSAGGGHVRDIECVLQAKVPVVKFLHCKTGVECDVSAENRDGIVKSELLHIFSLLDPRFRKLCFLTKAWANAHGINNSKARTLNSLSIILLVAFHLQTRTPAVLPPFSAILEGVRLRATSDTIGVVKKRAHKYKDFGRNNKESVVQLFHSLLIQLLAVKDLWQQGLCASTYEGTWTSKSKPGLIFVEDFTALSENAARAVGDNGFAEIYECFHETVVQLQQYFTGACEATALKSMLFSPSVKLSVKNTKRHLDNASVQVIETEHTLEMEAVGGPGHGAHYMAGTGSMLSDASSWIAFEEKPKYRSTAHDDVLGTSQIAIPALTDNRSWEGNSQNRYTHPMRDDKSVMSFPGHRPSKKIKFEEAAFRGEHLHYLPASTILPAGQGEFMSRSWDHRNLEVCLREEGSRYNTPGIERIIQGRTFLPIAADFDLRERAALSRAYLERRKQEYVGRVGQVITAQEPRPAFACTQLLPPVLVKDHNVVTNSAMRYRESTRMLHPAGHNVLVNIGGNYGENTGLSYPQLYANPVSSIRSNEPRWHNRDYETNRSDALYFSQRYGKYDGPSNQQNYFGWK